MLNSLFFWWGAKEVFSICYLSIEDLSTNECTFQLLTRIDAEGCLLCVTERRFPLARCRCLAHIDTKGLRSGGVTIAGTDYLPPPAGQLPELFNTMVEEIGKIPDIYDQADQCFSHHGSKERMRRTTTRPVKALDRNIKFNQALWGLIEKMAELKQADTNLPTVAA